MSKEKIGQEEYGPNETVGSFMAKKQRENENKLNEKYKSTIEEESVIKLLSISVVDKIKEYQIEIMEMDEGEEKEKYLRAIGKLLARLVQIKMPETMSKDDIKDLIIRAQERLDFLQEDPSINELYKIKLVT